MAEEEENNTLMDDLATAWEEAEEENNEEAELVEAAPETETAEPVVAEQPDGAESAEEEPPGTPPSEEQQDQQLIEDDGPPRGLSPAAREAWKDTPPEVQKEIAKREQDFSKGIQQYAQNAKRAQQMDQTLAPYNQLFAMNGGPANTLPGLLQTASQLQMGTPSQKAQTVANLIKQFDIDIGTLDSVLVGQAPPEQAPQQNIQEEIQRALAPMFQQQQQEQASTIQSELATFANDRTNEFYSDVRGDMADIMDVAARQGQQVSLKQAYDKACLMRDDIRQIVDARKSTDEVSQRRAAASSISGGPRGNEAQPQPESISDFLSAAWDQVDSR